MIGPRVRARAENADRRRMKALLQLASLLAIALLAFFFVARPAGAGAFPESLIREYESLLRERRPAAVSTSDVPSRSGKIVLIRPSSWNVYRLGTMLATQIDPGMEAKKDREIDPPRIDDSWYRLDPSLRASSPAEVETVIFCDYRKIPVREYRGIGDFYGPDASTKKTVTLVVFDWKTRRFMGECLLGEDPEKLSEATAGRYSGDPGEIASIVSKMPLERRTGGRAAP
jgi:hypothetical protein